jgi:hypothetical protein
MNRFASIIFVFVVGCAAEGQGIDVPFDSTSTSSKVPLRGPSGYDASPASIDAGANVDLGTLGDTRSQTVDMVVAPDTRVALDGLPCMQQVVANGYASDKASCATWTTAEFTEPYNSQLPVPWTARTACVALIDCYAANPTKCTSWADGNCPCIYPIPFNMRTDFGALRDIIAPFCPAFFVY